MKLSFGWWLWAWYTSRLWPGSRIYLSLAFNFLEVPEVPCSRTCHLREKHFRGLHCGGLFSSTQSKLPQPKLESSSAAQERTDPRCQERPIDFRKTFAPKIKLGSCAQDPTTSKPQQANKLLLARECLLQRRICCAAILRLRFVCVFQTANHPYTTLSREEKKTKKNNETKRSSPSHLNTR